MSGATNDSRPIATTASAMRAEIAAGMSNRECEQVPKSERARWQRRIERHGFRGQFHRERAVDRRGALRSSARSWCNDVWRHGSARPDCVPRHARPPTGPHPASTIRPATASGERAAVRFVRSRRRRQIPVGPRPARAGTINGDRIGFRDHPAGGEQGIRRVCFYLCAVGTPHDDRGKAIEGFERLRRRQFAATNEALRLPADIARQTIPNACHDAKMELIDGAPQHICIRRGGAADNAACRRAGLDPHPRRQRQGRAPGNEGRIQPHQLDGHRLPARPKRCCAPDRDAARRAESRRRYRPAPRAYPNSGLDRRSIWRAA